MHPAVQLFLATLEAFCPVLQCIGVDNDPDYPNGWLVRCVAPADDDLLLQLSELAGATTTALLVSHGTLVSLDLLRPDWADIR